MNPLEFLTTAETLSKLSGEADWRSSISRSYYALYQLFRVEIIKWPVAIREKAGLGKGHLVNHDRLCMCMKSHGDARIKEMGEYLETLKQSRHDADYPIDKKVKREQAEQELQNARDLESGINSYGGTGVVAARLYSQVQRLP